MSKSSLFLFHLYLTCGTVHHVWWCNSSSKVCSSCQRVWTLRSCKKISKFEHCFCNRHHILSMAKQLLFHKSVLGESKWRTLKKNKQGLSDKNNMFTWQFRTKNFGSVFWWRKTMPAWSQFDQWWTYVPFQCVLYKQRAKCSRYPSSSVLNLHLF